MFNNKNVRKITVFFVANIKTWYSFLEQLNAKCTSKKLKHLQTFDILNALFLILECKHNHINNKIDFVKYHMFVRLQWNIKKTNKSVKKTILISPYSINNILYWNEF